MQRIDAHCHVQFAAYDADRDEVIRRALAEGTGMIVVGTRRDTSEEAIAVAEQYDGAWATVGLHPSHLFPSFHDVAESAGSGTMETFDPAVYATLARSSKKVVAIGEFGIDYFHMPEGETLTSVRERQLSVFRAHLDLAWKLGLPAMIHVRDANGATMAHDDCATILEEYAAAGKHMKGNIHCFTGNSAEAARYVAVGFHVSFTGIVTFPPKKSEVGERLIDVAAGVPLDRLLIETDAPYLAPVPHRGARNEPAFVAHVAKAIAERRGMEVGEVEATTSQNCKTLFGLNFS